MAPRTSLRSFLTQHTTLALLLGFTGALAANAVACGAGGDEHGDTEGAGASAANGSGTSSGMGGGSFTTSNGSGGSGVGGGCAGTSQEASLIPLSMMIMFDRSGSMDANNKWDDATAAVRGFVQDPETAGLGVAIRFFPDNTCGEPTCDINACSQAVVDAAPLTTDPAPTDGQEAALVSAINNEGPNGDHTPIYAALGGAIQWARDYMSTHAGEKAVAVFVTDGEPNGCNEDPNAISALASDGLANGGVYSYAVGLEGSNEGLMNQIAQAGGTTQGIFISPGGTAVADLIAALKAIQGSQVSCDFLMPTPPPGEEIDPAKVNVTYTPGGGGSPSTIGQVAGAGDCANGGWYYDNPAEPTKITLCPSTCQAIQADPQAKVEIVLGCATQGAE